MKKSLYWLMLILFLSTSSILLTSAARTAKTQSFVFHNQMTTEDVDQLAKEMTKSNMKVTIHSIEYDSNGKLMGIHATVKKGSSWVRFCTDCVGKIIVSKSFMHISVHMDGNQIE